MEYEFRGNTDFLKPYKGKNSEIIFQINIVAPGAKANWLSMILIHDSVLTPLRVSSLFIANQYHSKCVLSFQTRRCAEPDIHYVDKVIFIRWYFVGQTMVDNVCGDRKQVIAVNDPNSSLNYPFVHTNKMAVQLSHTYYDYQLLCMITDHWSVYWYYCCRYHYFGGNYSRVHTNKSVWQPNIYLLDLFQLSLLLLSLELMLFTIICIINYSLVHTNIWWDNPISHHFPIRYNFLTNHFTRTTFELALSDHYAQGPGTRYSFDQNASH